MLARASFAAVLAACSVAVLVASSANAWGLSGKSSEPTQSDRLLPTSSTGTPDHVQDHYWWNVKTGPSLGHAALYADAKIASIHFWVHGGRTINCVSQGQCNGLTQIQCTEQVLESFS